MKHLSRTFNRAVCQDLVGIHEEIREKIEARIASFRKLWAKGTEREIFTELIFCLLTPQTKARQGEKAIALLTQKDLIFNGTVKELAHHLNIVRFRNKKAEYIIHARKKFILNGKPALKKNLRKCITPPAMRDFLVREVKGFGWKEASHFLRNIGLGKNFAILDRHILKNLMRAGCIERVPENLTRERYLATEERMRELSRVLNIPLEHLDFVLWYMETGDIYK